jgi:hypothetical protein
MSHMAVIRRTAEVAAAAGVEKEEEGEEEEDAAASLPGVRVPLKQLAEVGH